ncbi:MAG: extracellular solute-binding protein [Armatimonadota bacterium]|nr:extracellular solute-binding protein [Armatimonadota bacterium]
MTRRELLDRTSRLALGAGLASPLMTLLARAAAAAPSTRLTGALTVLLGSHMDPVKTLVAKYQEKYGVPPRVDLVTTPDLKNKLVAAFLARTSPWDAVFATAQIASSLASNKWVHDATWFIDELRKGREGRLLERGLSAAYYRGRIFAVPWVNGSQLLHWNKKLFRKAGLDPNAPLTWHRQKNTWDIFVEYAKKMTGRIDGQQVYGVTDAWAGNHVLWTWGGLLHMHGGRFLDEEFQPTWNSPAGVAATEKLVDLLHTHKVIDPAVTTYTWVFDASPAYFNGTRGMFITWPFIAGVANNPKASKIAGDSGFAPNPAVDTSGSVDGSEFFSVPVFAKNEAEAWRFLRLVTSREGQRIIALGGWAGIYRDVMTEPDILKRFPFYEALAVSYNYEVEGGWSPDRPVWQEILSNEIHEVIARKKKPREALNDAARRVIQSRKR